MRAAHDLLTASRRIAHLVSRHRSRQRRYRGSTPPRAAPADAERQPRRSARRSRPSSRLAPTGTGRDGASRRRQGPNRLATTVSGRGPDHWARPGNRGP
jgi:hypothetical protein